MKKIFKYSVALGKVLQKKSISPVEAVNTGQHIANKLKSSRQHTEHEFHQVYISEQESTRTKNSILEARHLTSKLINRCSFAAAADKEYFQVRILIPFFDNFIVTIELSFTAHKSIIGGWQWLIPVYPTAGPTIQLTESIQVLENLMQSLTKSTEELVPQLIFWNKNIFG